MSKNNYIRILKKPSYEVLIPIIRSAFQTSHDRFGLDNFSHSGVYFSQKDFDSLEADGAVWLGAFYGNELIGCLAFTAVSASKIRLHKLAIIPEKRNTGLGRFLMAAAEKEAFSRGTRKIELVCLANDEKLVGFYKQLGYLMIKEKTHRMTPWRIAYMEKRMPHLVDQVGSRVLAFQMEAKSFNGLLQKAFEIVLVYHPDEIVKQSNTGHVVQRGLPEHTKEIIWHRNTIDGKISELSTDFETVLLYPTEHAVDLIRFCRGNHDDLPQNDSSDKIEYHKPIRLVVVDGTWQQAQKMMAQSPSLRALQHVKLVHIPKSQYILRKNQKPQGLCTIEAIAEAISELGYPEVKAHLMAGFFKWMAKGVERYGLNMGANDDEDIHMSKVVL